VKEVDSIEFIVRGVEGEKQISPKNISLSLLSTFTKDIESLIKSIPESKKEDVVVSVEEGSFKVIVVIGLIAFNAFKADITTLESSNDLNSINVKRSSIIEGWLAKTKLRSDLEYEIIPHGTSGIKLNSKSNIERIESDIWVESEIYLYGIVNDLGGQSKPNIHLKIENGTTITIACKKEDIASETENKVYKPASIRVLAQQNLITGEVKDAEFISFEDYNPTFDEQELLKSIANGRDSWTDVDDHVEWVRNLRTDNE